MVFLHVLVPAAPAASDAVKPPAAPKEAKGGKKEEGGGGSKPKAALGKDAPGTFVRIEDTRARSP